MNTEGWAGHGTLLDEVPDEPARERSEAGDPSTTDIVRLYLNDAGRHQLLDAEREADLAKRYRAGLHAREMRRTAGRLPARRRRLLEQLVRDGDDAQRRMTEANLLLVVSLSRRYAGRGLDFIELIQEGNLGLLRAVEKFDHTRGYKFSTYATWWIRQALQRGLASKARTIRVPSHVGDLYNRVRAAEIELYHVIGREPTDAELADEAGLDLQRMRDVRGAMHELVSLDRPVGEDADASMGDILADPRVTDPAQNAARRDASSQIEAVLEHLDERERIILILRFGLNGDVPHTLEEVGARIGVTRERVRQMQERALASLRHPARAGELSELLAAYEGAVA